MIIVTIYGFPSKVKSRKSPSLFKEPVSDSADTAVNIPRKKRIVLMPDAQYEAGAKGELVRKGRYGISFTPEVEDETKDPKKYYQKNKFKK